MEYFVYLLASFLAVMIVITTHEFAHAFVAYKCGDPTAKFAGRMSLNPVRHFDPLGIVMFAFAGFGWAKPVPVNPYNFRNYKSGSFWTASAGVIVNYLSAFLFFPLVVLVKLYVLPLVEGTYLEIFLSDLTWLLLLYSLNFCIFNLLPLHPLDGFRIMDALNKKRGKVYQFLRNYGHYILLALVFINFLSDRIPYLAYIDVLGFVLPRLVSLVGKPIALFWGWIFDVTIII